MANYFGYLLNNTDKSGHKWYIVLYTNKNLSYSQAIYF